MRQVKVATATVLGLLTAGVAPPRPPPSTCPYCHRTVGRHGRPGIPGGVPHYAVVHTTLDAATFGNGVTDATAAVNLAIQAAGADATAEQPRVVYLPAGVYRITDTLVIDRSHVVLRGAGKGKTIVRMATAGRGAFRVGRLAAYTGAVNVAGACPRGRRGSPSRTRVTCRQGTSCRSISWRTGTRWATRDGSGASTPCGSCEGPRIARAPTVRTLPTATAPSVGRSRSPPGPTTCSLS